MLWGMGVGGSYEKNKYSTHERNVYLKAASMDLNS